VNISNEPYNKNRFALPAQTTAGTFTHQLDLTTTLGGDSIVLFELASQSSMNRIEMPKSLPYIFFNK